MPGKLKETEMKIKELKRELDGSRVLFIIPCFLMILGKLKTKQALFDETIDNLASFASDEILFGVYEDLLRKYGLRASEQTGIPARVR